MKVEIEIPDEEIEVAVFQHVTRRLSDQIFSELGNTYEREFRKFMKDTLRDILRERSDEIVERSLPYVGGYIGKKGVKKLVDKLEKGGDEA